MGIVVLYICWWLSTCLMILFSVKQTLQSDFSYRITTFLLVITLCLIGQTMLQGLLWLNKPCSLTHLLLWGSKEFITRFLGGNGEALLHKTQSKVEFSFAGDAVRQPEFYILAPIFNTWTTRTNATSQSCSSCVLCFALESRGTHRKKLKTT